MNLSVIIPTFKRENRLRDLLGSLERQNVSITYEVIVVANLPEPGLKKIVESYGFRYFETGRIGVNIARNKGLALGRGELILFLDDDTYLTDRDLIQKHYVAHNDHREAAVIGGTFAPKASLSPTEAAYHWILDHELRSHVGERQQARSVSAAHMSIKAEMIGSTRFDDRNSSEESFLETLHREQNIFLLIEELSVEHRIRVSPFDLAKKAFYRGYDLALVDRALERPRWNSLIPLEDTLRRANVANTWRTQLYHRFFDYGSARGLEDRSTYFASAASKKIAYRRPDFQFLKPLLERKPLTGNVRTAFAAALSAQD